MECVFCKIVNNQLPSFKVAETEDYLAFLDIKPVKPGHTLVIPKKHYDDLASLPAEPAAELVKFAQQVALAVMAATGAEGFNLTLNNGAAAGQIIFHTHFHIIPRQAQDNLLAWPHGQYDAGQGERLAELIRQKVNLT